MRDRLWESARTSVVTAVAMCVPQVPRRMTHVWKRASLYSTALLGRAVRAVAAKVDRRHQRLHDDAIAGALPVLPSATAAPWLQPPATRNGSILSTATEKQPRLRWSQFVLSPAASIDTLAERLNQVAARVNGRPVVTPRRWRPSDGHDRLRRARMKSRTGVDA